SSPARCKILPAGAILAGRAHGRSVGDGASRNTEKRRRLTWKGMIPTAVESDATPRLPRGTRPGGHCLLEDLIALCALLEGENGALARLIDEGKVDPVSLAQQSEVGRDVGVGGGEGDPEEAVGNLRLRPDERLTAGFLGRLHHDARHL